MPIKHAKVSTIPDGADASLVRPSEWNAAHAWPSWWTVNETLGAEALAIAGLVSANAFAFAPPVTRTIVGGAINVTGVSYVIVSGEGGLDDTLNIINGGVDGQVLIIEQGAQVVTIAGAGGNIELVNKEKTSTILKDLLGQVMLIYSVAQGKWWCWDHGVSDILSPDGQTEIIAGNGSLDGLLSSTSIFHAVMATATLGIWQIQGDLLVHKNAFGEGAHFHLMNTTAPATPGSGTLAIYAKDKAGVSTLYIKKDNGVEVELG